MVSHRTPVGAVAPLPWLPCDDRRRRDAAAAPADRWLLPGDARILIRRGSGMASAHIGSRGTVALPPLAVAGPSSQPMRITTDADAAVSVVTLSALDWVQLIGLSASAAANGIVGPEHLRGGWFVEELADAAATADDGRDIAPGVRAIAARHLANGGPPRERLVAGLMAAIEAGHGVSAGGTAALLGTSREVLGRVALRHFGFSTKLLLMRHRFLTAFARFRQVGLQAAAAENGYAGVPHLLRDANLFLGTTPRRYIERSASAG